MGLYIYVHVAVSKLTRYLLYWAVKLQNIMKLDFLPLTKLNALRLFSFIASVLSTAISWDVNQMLSTCNSSCFFLHLVRFVIVVITLKRPGKHVSIFIRVSPNVYYCFIIIYLTAHWIYAIVIIFHLSMFVSPGYARFACFLLLICTS